jgi:hypothetical protein
MELDLKRHFYADSFMNESAYCFGRLCVCVCVCVSRSGPECEDLDMTEHLPTEDRLC